MYFALLTATLATLTIAEISPAEPAHNWTHSLALLAIAIAALAWTALSGAQAFAAEVDRWIRQGAGARWMTAYRRFRLAYLCLATLAGPLAIYLTAWPQVVRHNLGLAGSILVDELAILGPVLAALLAGLLAFAQVDHAVLKRTTEHAAPPPPHWLCLAGLQMRHYFGFLLLPVLAALLLGELLDLLAAPGPAVQVAAASLVLALLCIGFPALLCRIWPTHPLPSGPVRRELQRTLDASGLAVREMLVWGTGGVLVNAAVLGFSARFRYVLLTDELVRRFSTAELRAVLLHEAAHVHRRHLPLRLAVIGAPLLAWYLAGAVHPEFLDLAVETLAACGLSALLQSHVLFPLVLAAYLAAGLCITSRLLEYDADVWAADQAARTDLGRDGYLQMLARLERESGGKQGGWLHPRIRDRLALAACPPLSAARQKHVRRFQALLLAAVGATAAGILAALLA